MSADKPKLSNEEIVKLKKEILEFGVKPNPKESGAGVEEWEKEFDEKFGFMFRVRKAGKNSLKSFISQAVATAVEQKKAKLHTYLKQLVWTDEDIAALDRRVFSLSVPTTVQDTREENGLATDI